MRTELTKEQQKALEENAGFVEGTSYVIMSKKVYRQTLGVESDEELAASLKAVRQGLADIESGRTRPFSEVLSELSKDNEV